MDLQPTASPLEEELGIRFYATKAKGIGGRLRSRPEDFIVEEITKEGLVANHELGGLFRGEGRYSLAVLTKTSRNTIPISRQIGKILGASVCFAGIKDRRAITSQLISIDRRLEQRDLELKIPGATVRVVGVSKWPLEAGELRGNHFTITIRGLQKGLPETFKADWLPGYFGHQRFGTTRPNTHRIGRFLVKKDFEGAVRELVAEPYPNEPEDIAQARADLKASWDISRALKNFPRSLAYERMVLMRLMEAPGDPLRALKALPWSIIRLYINAYQSYLFNLALSRRWEQYGLGSLENGDYASPLDKWGSPARPIKMSQSNAAILRKMVASGKGVLMMRVVGARTEMEGKDRDVYFEILETEGITLHDFENIAGSPFFGTLRFSLFRPFDFSISEVSPDELSHSMQRQTVKTSLPKGCYATVLLREMMRPADPFTAGF